MTVVIDGTTGIDTGTGSLIAANASTPTYLDLFEDTDNGSNYVRLIAPTSVAANRTITLPDGTGTVAVNGVNGVLVSGTAQTAPFASPNTSCDFTGIPSWVKRITVMFSGVSTNGTSAPTIILGDSGGFETNAYAGAYGRTSGSAVAAAALSTGGFYPISGGWTAAATLNGSVVITLLNASTNTWTFTSLTGTSLGEINWCGGSKSLSDTLTQVRITTANGTDTFDAGTINILYE